MLIHCICTLRSGRFVLEGGMQLALGDMSLAPFAPGTSQCSMCAEALHTACIQASRQFSPVSAAFLPELLPCPDPVPLLLLAILGLPSILLY